MPQSGPHTSSGNPESQAEVKFLFDRVRRNFNELLYKDANPLEAALALMDASSIGKARHSSDFEQLHTDLKNCLRTIVDENYNGFSSSVGYYHAIVDSVKESQIQLHNVNKNMSDLQVVVKNRKSGLKELQERSLKYKEVLRLIDVIEDLKKVPDRFEEKIGQKRFLEGHEILQSALSLIISNNIINVGAVKPLHSYVITQQRGLPSTLQEEISSHLYLRSPHTASRWQECWAAENAAGIQVDVIQPPGESRDGRPDPRFVASSAKDHGPEKWLASTFHISTDLSRFLDSLPKPLEMAMETLDIAEEDSLQYLRFSIETVAKLGRLEQVLDFLVENVSKELKQLTEMTVGDFVQKYKISTDLGDALAKTPTLEQINNPSDACDALILEAFAFTICSKFVAVIENHRVIYEVTKKCSDLTYDLESIYRAVESEIRAILMSYIAEKPSPTSALRIRSSAGQLSDADRSGANNSQAVFQIARESADPQMSSNFEELRKTMNLWIPGVSLAMNNLDDSSFTPYADLNRQRNLILLVPPNILNIRSLMRPISEFLIRTKANCNDSKDLEGVCSMTDKFLEQFLLSIYLPRLRTALEQVVDGYCNSADSQNVYPSYSNLSQLPLSNAVVNMVKLIYRLCILASYSGGLPNFQSQLVLELVEYISTYLQTRYSECSQTLDPKEAGSLGPNNCEIKKLHKIIRQLVTGTDEMRTSEEVNKATLDEVKLFVNGRLQSSKPGTQIRQADLFSPEGFKEIALLSSSARWAALRLRSLIQSAQNPDQNTPDLKKLQGDQTYRNWNFESLPKNSETDYLFKTQVHLSKELFAKVDVMLTKMESFSFDLLSALRCDILSRTVFAFDQMAITDSSNFANSVDTKAFNIGRPASMKPGELSGLAAELAPDSYLDFLQRRLSSDHAVVAERLSPEYCAFIFAGIAKLMNELMIYESEKMAKIDEGWRRRILSDILSLQQSLKLFVFDVTEVEFSRAVEYYMSFHETPAKMLDAAKHKKTILTEDDLQVFLRVKLREDMAKKERDDSVLLQSYQLQSGQLREIFQGKE